VSFIEELKRRNVFRVGFAYVVVAWVIAQVADLVLENITAPDWLMQAILLILASGLPIALIFAWAFEMTSEGLKKEKDVDRSQSITPKTGRKLNALIMGMLVIALGYFAYDKFILRPGGEIELITAETSLAEPAPAVADELPREKSIAVLPFANRSSREEDEFFTEGIHDDLLTRLSKIGSMKVISRTSVLRYKDSKKSIPEIAAELNVTTVLEGGIQRSGDQIRINVQLIDAKTDEHLWAETFDRKLTAENLFAIQSEISTAIASALEATLSAEEETRLKIVPTINMAAYTAYLRGRQLQTRRTSTDLEQALAEFTRATELDPAYALAWVGVAESANLLVDYGSLSATEAREKGGQAIRNALAINSDLGEAYASLGMEFAQQQKYSEAEASYKRAIELSPNYASSYQWYSGLLSNMPDRLDESVAIIEKAAELDPMSSIIKSNLAGRLWASGRYDEAEAQFLQVIELDPDFAINYSSLASFYSNTQGRFADALKWSRVARQKDPGSVELLRREATIFLHVEDFEAVDSLRRQMLDMDPQHWSVGAVDWTVNLSKQNYAGAIEAGQWLIPRTSNQPIWQQWVAFTYMLDGNFSRARELLFQVFPGWEDPEKWAQLIQANSFEACLVAGILAGNGETTEADALMNQVTEYYATLPSQIDHADNLAPVDCWAAQGEQDKALDMLETQIEHGHIAFWWIAYQWPWWDNVRSEPRFQAAMQTIAERVAEQRQLMDQMKLL
jgi:TolB-like protein/Tfp pilus assembly protein PilF